MPHMELVSSSDILNMEDVYNYGKGAQALAGATGLGFPEVSSQWIEGAGDGAKYRGSRLRSRKVDLPIYLSATNRARLQETVDRLDLMLAGGEFQIRWVEDDGTYWYLTMAWSGGGSWTTGIDTTGETDLKTVISLQGSPYWTSSVSSSEVVRNSGAGRGLLNGPLSAMRVTASQAIGTIQLRNTGTAPAYPVWRVVGPGSNFTAVSPTGETLRYTGTISASGSITLDTSKGTVVDGAGTNLYNNLAAAPKFWAIPPGTSVCTASLDGTSTNSSITCTWQPRKRAVI